MATGDAAAAAGLRVVPPTEDVREGYDAINERGDELAAHLTTGTHKWSQITEKPSLVLSSDVAAASQATPNKIPRYTANGQLTTTTPVSAAHAASKGYADSGDQSVREDAQTSINLAVAGRALAYGGDANAVAYANGPTSAAYNREAGGSRFAVWMDGTQQFGRAVSSRRYKDEIEPHEIDPDAVLALVPVTYHYKSDPPGVRELGLIAEDVDAAGLPEIVTTYDGRIDGLRYDLLGVLLLPVVKRQQEQISALAARLDELTTPTTDPTPET